MTLPKRKSPCTTDTLEAVGHSYVSSVTPTGTAAETLTPESVFREYAPRIYRIARRIRSGAVGQIVDLAGDRPQPLGLGGPDHGNEQPLIVEIDSDADVDEVVHDQILIGHAGVEVGELAERVHHGAGDERQVGEAEALGRLEGVLLPAPGLLDLLVVDLDGRHGVG